jgi:hypothetical protein
MITKRITYTDYNGNVRTEDFSFNLNQAEVVNLEVEVEGGLSETLKQIIKTNNKAEILKLFQKIILLSYGEKSPDGKFFRKSKEILDSFTQTEAYPVLFTELTGDAKAASEFVNGILANIKVKEDVQN